MLRQFRDSTSLVYFVTGGHVSVAAAVVQLVGDMTSAAERWSECRSGRTEKGWNGMEGEKRDGKG